MFCVCRTTTTTSWDTWDHSGFVPEQNVTVVEVAPFEGPVTVEVKGIRTAIAREIAALVTVALV